MHVYSYSRRIMWARVAFSNNNPSIIAQYYMECIETVGGYYNTVFLTQLAHLQFYYCRLPVNNTS